MAFSTSEYLSSKQRVLNKQQIGDIIARLEELDHREMIKSVKDDVGGGHHLNFFQTGVLVKSLATTAGARHARLRLPCTGYLFLV